MERKLLLIFFMVTGLLSWSQPYSSELLGDPTDANVSSHGGYLLAGGGVDNDSAMVWFLEQANGGDVVVLRTEPIWSYTYYLYQLGVQVNSVETIAVPSISAANDPYVVQQLQNAEAIFIAGGDQTEYYEKWTNTHIDTILSSTSTNSPVIGGTSAGLMVLGDIDYYPLSYGVLSSEALSNPYHPYMDTIVDEGLIEKSKLSDLLFDTHFVVPQQIDRRGRLVTMLARGLEQHNKKIRAVGINEVTAIALDRDGKGVVYGEYPDYEDYTYFIEPTCPLSWINYPPENMENNEPLTWNYDGKAIKVLKVAGTPNGSDTVDITDFGNSSAGQWYYWYVEDGELYEVPLNQEPECFDNLSVDENTAQDLYFFSDQNTIQFYQPTTIRVHNTVGQLLINKEQTTQEDLSSLQTGIYIIELVDQKNRQSTSFKWLAK